MDEEIKKALDAKFEKLQQDLADAQKNGASKDEVLKLHDMIEKQGTAIEEFMESQKKKVLSSMKEQLNAFLTEKKDTIKEIFQKGSGTIEMTVKAVGDMTTGSGSNITTPSHLMHTDLGNIALRDDSALLNLATISSTGEPRLSYTEAVPKEGGYAFVLEGTAKPQIDFKWENRFVEPKKAAAYEILTEESVTDVARLQSVAEDYLVKKHNLFKADKVYFGSGASGEPTGATVYGRTFVAGDMAGMFPNGSTNFMDVVNAIITDIYTTQTYVDEPHHMPNIVLVSPVDFFKELVAAKDNNGLPLYPQAGLFNQVRIGGVLIKPWIKIPAGKIFVADMSKYNIVNYVPFSIRIGWINDQFITNKFTILGESRYYQYVKNLDIPGFVYDDIATVRTAIEAV